MGRPFSRLDWIGQRHGTDKASVLPDGSKGHDYLRVYQPLMEQTLTRRLNYCKICMGLGDRVRCQHCGGRGVEVEREAGRLLEIGVEYGKSIKTWIEAYPEATIIGVDKNPLWSPDLSTPTAVGIHKCDVSEDVEGFREILSTYGPFDFIIDDASHRSEETLPTFREAWHYLNPGGWYTIEDTQTDLAGSGWPTEPQTLIKLVTSLVGIRKDPGEFAVEEIRLVDDLWLFKKPEGE